MKRVVLGIFLASICTIGKAQDAGDSAMPERMWKAIMADDSVSLTKVVNKANVNDCYGNYSVLSNAIRMGATKCFYMLIGDGADVNKSCNGYVPPIMHAAKYGRLEMLKALIAKGADPHLKYEGTCVPAQEKTPTDYAEMFHQDVVVAYLKSLP